MDIGGCELFKGPLSIASFMYAFVLVTAFPLKQHLSLHHQIFTNAFKVNLSFVSLLFLFINFFLFFYEYPFLGFLIYCSHELITLVIPSRPIFKSVPWFDTMIIHHVCSFILFCCIPYMIECHTYLAVFCLNAARVSFRYLSRACYFWLKDRKKKPKWVCWINIILLIIVEISVVPLMVYVAESYAGLVYLTFVIVDYELAWVYFRFIYPKKKEEKPIIALSNQNQNSVYSV